MKRACRIICVVFILVSSNLTAQQPVAGTDAVVIEQAEHDALRELRESLTSAVMRGDVEQQLSHAHPTIVTTWQSNQVARGYDGIRELMGEMNSGDDKVFQGYTVPPTSDDLAILHGGDTAIAAGSSVPHYKILGMEFDLENRWTATLVKEDGQWKLAAYHVSGNVLDNPVLTIAKKSVYWSAGIALVIGLVLGAIGMKLVTRKPQTSTAT